MRGLHSPRGQGRATAAAATPDRPRAARTATAAVAPSCSGAAKGPDLLCGPRNAQAPRLLLALILDGAERGLVLPHQTAEIVGHGV